MYTRHIYQNLMPFPSILFSTYILLQLKITASTRVTGLRALTSAEGYVILHEKEEKREEKDWRNQEREQKWETKTI